MSFIGLLHSALFGFLDIFWYWLSLLFVIPFRDPEVLWILVPAWINFIFTDFFQEKKGTSMSNAITNGALMLWVGIDWLRFLTRHFESVSWLFVFKTILCFTVALVGLIIIIGGIRGKAVMRIVGRIRVASYIMFVLSPLMYAVIEPTLRYLTAIIIFYPAFYYFFEYIDRKIPGLDVD